jgi:peptidyl-tRNA hydrolase, PTH2 family
MSECKQVIVMRTDLKMRPGKMVVQGAHASAAWLSHRVASRRNPRRPSFSDAEHEWLYNSFVKVCVGVDSLEALMEIYNDALENGLQVELIEDDVITEFHGEKTPTCLAIGPDWSIDMDKVTRHLSLL